MPEGAAPSAIAPSAIAVVRRRPALAPLRRRGMIWIQALGLDAVAVALTWQQALSQVAQQTPLIWARLGLAVTVAFIYILDRHLDAARAVNGQRLSPRHRIHARFARFFRGTLIALAIAIAALLPTLRIETLEVAAGLAALVALYLAAVQLLPRSMRSGTKELTVGLVFAAGCAAHALPRQPHHDLFPTLLLTGLLFSLNCVSISTREADLDRAQGSAGARVPTRWLIVALAAVAASAILFRSPLMLPIVLSAALLAYLHLTPRPPRRTLLHHLAADAALLTPLLFAWPLA